MVSRLTPYILSNLVPPYTRENNPYNLRNAEDIQTIHARTNIYFNSFLPATIRDWNSLPLHVRQSDSILLFKKHLNSNLIPTPKFYNAGTRLGQILHTRLRLECSSLTSYLHARNLIESPLCSCGEIENANHFIFRCVNFSAVRQKYMADLVQEYYTERFIVRHRRGITGDKRKHLYTSSKLYNTH